MPLRFLPDSLTILRVVASPFLAWLLVRGKYREALLLVMIAGVTDWLDGYTARKLGVTGRFGTLLDPLADKAMLVTLFLALGYVRLVPGWLVVIVMGRDLVIVGGAILLRIFRGIRTFRPSTIGKVSTFFQIILVLLVLTYAAFDYKILLLLKDTALVLSTIFTSVSWADYVRQGIQMTRRGRVEAA